MSVTLRDGLTVAVPLAPQTFAPSSLIEEIVYSATNHTVEFRTSRNDVFSVELPQLEEQAPLRGRPTIYLDQNHWSTLTSAIYRPDRVSPREKLNAAARLIELANAHEVVLPMSAAHVSETCKQADFERRYERALTIARLSSGWQLRDPIHVRRLELQRALAERSGIPDVVQPPVVTLDPEALFAGIPFERVITAGLPVDGERLVHLLTCISGLFDTMLDADHVPFSLNPGWADQFQRFAEFLRDNPTSSEMKRRRTFLRFSDDLKSELARAALSAGVTPQQMSEWCQAHFEADLSGMPALGIYREVIHEKLCDGSLQWKDNDLVDMLFLTTAAGYCDHVVAERAHASHIEKALQRLGRPVNVHRSLRSLVAAI